MESKTVFCLFYECNNGDCEKLIGIFASKKSALKRKNAYTHFDRLRLRIEEILVEGA